MTLFMSYVPQILGFVKVSIVLKPISDLLHFLWRCLSYWYIAASVDFRITRQKLVCLCHFKQLIYSSSTRDHVALLYFSTDLFCLCLVAPCRCEYFRCAQPSSRFCTEGVLLSGFHWALAGCHIVKQNPLAQHKDRPSSSGGNNNYNIKYYFILKWQFCWK